MFGGGGDSFTSAARIAPASNQIDAPDMAWPPEAEKPNATVEPVASQGDTESR
jgi:hypothetical protein